MARPYRLLVPIWTLRQILEVGVINDSLLIPCKHGVDGLGQLGAAAFVDAVGVDLSEADVLAPGENARPFDLRLCCLGLYNIETLHVSEGHFPLHVLCVR